MHGTLWLTVLVSAALLAGGCGDGGDKADGDRAGAGETAATGTDNPMQDVRGPVHYTSAESRFDIVWPSGCARIRNRAFPLDDSEDEPVYVRQRYYCDRDGYENEGCAVGVQFLRNLSTAPEATPELVIESTKSVMTAYRVDILRQSPIVRGELEGIGLHCVSIDGGPGTLWIEAFPWDGSIYTLTAWSENRSIFDVEEFKTFFTSFNPWPPEEGAGQ